MNQSINKGFSTDFFENFSRAAVSTKKLLLKAKMSRFDPMAGQKFDHAKIARHLRGVIADSPVEDPANGDLAKSLVEGYEAFTDKNNSASQKFR